MSIESNQFLGQYGDFPAVLALKDLRNASRFRIEKEVRRFPCLVNQEMMPALSTTFGYRRGCTVSEVAGPNTLGRFLVGIYSF